MDVIYYRLFCLLHAPVLTSTAMIRHFLLYSVVLATALSVGYGARQKPRGHLQYFGSHQPAEGEIETLNKFPTSEDFYEIYVAPRIPVKFRQVLTHQNMPAYGLWTDAYLK